MPQLFNQASSEHNVSQVSAAKRILQMEQVTVSVSSGKAGIGHGRRAVIGEVKIKCQLSKSVLFCVLLLKLFLKLEEFQMKTWRLTTRGCLLIAKNFSKCVV